MLTSRELATVLAALRYWQGSRPTNRLMFHIIATNGDRHSPLDDNEIDELCMRLNFGEVSAVEEEPPETGGKPPPLTFPCT